MLTFSSNCDLNIEILISFVSNDNLVRSVTTTPSSCPQGYRQPHSSLEPTLTNRNPGSLLYIDVSRPLDGATLQAFLDQLTDFRAFLGHSVLTQARHSPMRWSLHKLGVFSSYLIDIEQCLLERDYFSHPALPPANTSRLRSLKLNTQPVGRCHVLPAGSKPDLPPRYHRTSARSRPLLKHIRSRT